MHGRLLSRLLKKPEMLFSISGKEVILIL